MPLNDGDTWELTSKTDDTLVAKMVFKSGDFPWVICDFQPTEVFEQYRKLFNDELELLDQTAISDSDENWTIWGDKYQEIIDTLKLVALDKANPVGDFLLHIYDKEAHFRA
jgi:hypothetical protein